jgi:hypothetical protein
MNTWHSILLRNKKIGIGRRITPSGLGTESLCGGRRTAIAEIEDMQPGPGKDIFILQQANGSKNWSGVIRAEGRPCAMGCHAN